MRGLGRPAAGMARRVAPLRTRRSSSSTSGVLRLPARGVPGRRVAIIKRRRSTARNVGGARSARDRWRCPRGSATRSWPRARGSRSLPRMLRTRRPRAAPRARERQAGCTVAPRAGAPEEHRGLARRAARWPRRWRGRRRAGTRTEAALLRVAPRGGELVLRAPPSPRIVRRCASGLPQHIARAERGECVVVEDRTKISAEGGRWADDDDGAAGAAKKRCSSDDVSSQRGARVRMRGVRRSRRARAKSLRSRWSAVLGVSGVARRRSRRGGPAPPSPDVSRRGDTPSVRRRSGALNSARTCTARRTS